MIKTKQELLNHFSDINEMYNNPFKYQTLSNMIDELLVQQPCEDTLDKIITQIEQAREKDKLCKYPYSRCIEIIKKHMEDKISEI